MVAMGDSPPSSNLWKLIRAILLLLLGFLGGWVGNEGKHQGWDASKTWSRVTSDASVAYQWLKNLWPKESASSVNGRRQIRESSSSRSPASRKTLSSPAVPTSSSLTIRPSAAELREAEAALRKGIEYLRRAEDAGTAAGVVEYSEAALDLLERAKITFAQALAQQPDNPRLVESLSETIKQIELARRLLHP